jgi:metallophosphoesterase (TIGR03768 family)
MPDPADPKLSPNGGTALTWSELDHVSDYDALGYGQWEYVDQPLPIVSRTDIMPTGYAASAAESPTKLLNFATMSDVHLTDKEAPNQLIFLQKNNPGFAGQNTSIYSGVMLYTAHVFDAAIQTTNALHKENPLDFLICLGDACNTTMYNELRWFIDIIDGKVITPSSGDHLGADTVDYQKPFKAAGLDKSIPFYQTLGNHDHFMIGSFAVYESGLEQSYTSDKVWSVPNELLTPNLKGFPALFNKHIITDQSLTHFYQGVIDGSTADGKVIKSGAIENFDTPPLVTADPDRRSLHRAEWIQEFFNTTSSPVGHGFNHVSSNPNYGLVPDSEKAGFACYSFVPKSDVPLKVIVLDDTQREDDGSVDIHGHGFLDATRWAWLQAELDDGQAANQLMIIAAHIPIGVANIGTELEWWLGDKTAKIANAVPLNDLVDKLQNSTNLLMWIAGHRHLNHVKAFVSPDASKPEKGFWQVETSSLRDFPQQFRTFEIFLNSDYTVSIEAVNVDPAVAEGTPAAKSRKNAIAAQQIVHNNLTMNPINYSKLTAEIPLPSMDPTRPQGGIQTDPQSTDSNFTDPSIQYLNLDSKGIQYNASYNARLFKQLSPTMRVVMQNKFPQA